MSGFTKTNRDNIEIALEKQVLVVSLGAKLKIAKCKQIRDWFLANEFADFGDPVTSFFMHARLPQGFVDDANVRADVVKYFSSFDETIKDFHVEKVPTDNAEGKDNDYESLSILNENPGISLIIGSEQETVYIAEENKCKIK